MKWAMDHGGRWSFSRVLEAAAQFNSMELLEYIVEKHNSEVFFSVNNKFLVYMDYNRLGVKLIGAIHFTKQWFLIIGPWQSG